MARRRESFIETHGASLGVKPVRELAGVIASSDAVGGFFVASGRYTEEARRFARTVEIELIDGEGLAEMVRSVRNGPPLIEPTISGMRETTTWSNGTDVPTCPNCGRDMLAALRSAARTLGVNSGVARSTQDAEGHARSSSGAADRQVKQQLERATQQYR